MGSGTNDAPSIKQADIGVALGISSTDIARNASDLIVLDDSTHSILNAIVIGRNITKNYKKAL